VGGGVIIQWRKQYSEKRSETVVGRVNGIWSDNHEKSEIKPTVK